MTTDFRELVEGTGAKTRYQELLFSHNTPFGKLRAAA